MRLRRHTAADALVLTGMPSSGTGTSGQRVIRGPDGLPAAIELFGPGNLSITRNGESDVLEISPGDIGSILDYHALKGHAIPIDCEHILQILADLRGVTESELIEAEPALGEQAGVGAVSLYDEGGTLWARVEKLTERAKQLLAGTADKLYLYFSPVVRGLKTGRPQVTSLALTNHPAINGLDMIPASDGAGATDRLEHWVAGLPPKPQGRRHGMDEWLKKLAGLLKWSGAEALTDETDTGPLMKMAVERIEALTPVEAAVTKFRGDLTKALSLTDADDLPAIAGKVLSVVAKSEGDATALADVTARLEALEGDKKTRRIAQYQAEGKLTKVQLPWAQEQSVDALTEWAKTAPVVVQPKRIVKAGDVKPSDTETMTDVDVDIAKACGADPKKVAEANGLCYEG